MFKMTYHRGLAGVRVIHAAQGGGPGTVDDEGRPRYIAGVSWCGIEHRAKHLRLVEVDQKPTCLVCLRALRAVEKRRAKRA